MLNKQLIIINLFLILIIFKFCKCNKMTVKYYKNSGHRCEFFEQNQKIIKETGNIINLNEKIIRVEVFYKYTINKLFGKKNYFFFLGEQGDLYYLKEEGVKKCTNLIYTLFRWIKDLNIVDGNVCFFNYSLVFTYVYQHTHTQFFLALITHWAKELLKR